MIRIRTEFLSASHSPAIHSSAPRPVISPISCPRLTVQGHISTFMTYKYEQEVVTLRDHNESNYEKKLFSEGYVRERVVEESGTNIYILYAKSSNNAEQNRRTMVIRSKTDVRTMSTASGTRSFRVGRVGPSVSAQRCAVPHRAPHQRDLGALLTYRQRA